MGGTDGLIHQFGVAATDDGLAPVAKWRFGNRQLAGPSFRARAESLDSFFAVTAAAQTVTVKVGTTDTLGAAPTFPAELTDTFDIGSADDLRQGAFATATPGYGTGLAEARFLSLQYEIDTVTDWSWEAAHLRTDVQRTSSP